MCVCVCRKAQDWPIFIAACHPHISVACIVHNQGAIPMGDALAELEREVAKQKEEQEAEDKRRRASQNALSNLDRMPPPEVQQPAQQDHGETKAEKPAGPDPTAAAATGNATSSAYIPPGWNTASRQQNDSAVAATAPVGPEWQSPAPLLDSKAVSLPMCGCGANGEPFGADLFAMVGLHAPTEDSFEQFFKRWFELDFFPEMSESLKRELVQRAKSKGFFSGLSSQIKKFAMANTDARLQSDVWCKYFTENAPPKYRVIGCVRLASVNIGAQAAPCWVTFWGIQDSQGDSWHLPPWASKDADVGAVLDELDGRGGMAALIAASA